MAAQPECAIEIEVIRTSAEIFPEKSIARIGVGVFTQELDEALFDGRIDLAVHSLKDLASTLDSRLCLAAVPERESPFDLFVAPDRARLEDLPPGASIGTGSPRRKAQLLAYRSDLKIVPLRGNVDTRLRKVRELGLAGTILAHAGLKRLGKHDLITAPLSPDILLPAVAQGALGIVTRADDDATIAAVGTLQHAASRARVDAERSYLRELRGGCQVPAGALAEVDGERLAMVGVLAAEDGSTCLRGQREGSVEDGERLGAELARELLDRGGEAILAGVRGDAS